MKALLHSPLSLFVAQALAIIGLSRLIGLGARKLRQPMVVAEIVAGIALGPSLLGWLAPGVGRALFPAESMGMLGMLSQVGLILFMFLVGLEFDPKLLRGRGHTSIVISHTSIVVPFALGAAIALYLYPRLSPASVPFSSFTLFMGVAMSITAFPVLARILVERRLLRTKVGALTITCAAVDDVTAWCILAFVVAIVRATVLMEAVRTTVFALIYLAFMFFVGRPFLRRLSERTGTREGLSQNLVAVMLGLLLLSSWATELIGIHGLFGAFVIGAILPKENGFAQALAEKLEDLVVVFFLPLFFAYSGLRTQIGLLDSPGAWSMCGLIIAIACLGKFGGSAVAARLTGLRWREASALGILMNTRGLIELVVLNIGLDLGVISPTLFTMMVVMALVTTFMTSPLLEWVYPLSQLTADLVEAPASTPAPMPAGFRVLVCVSSERSGPGLIALAGALVGRTDEARRLYALRLVPPADRASFVLDQRRESNGTKALDPLLAKAKEMSLDVRPLSFVSADPSRDICRVAEAKHAGIVLLGWHKPLLGNTVLSGVVHAVMREAVSDVGVFVDRGLSQVKKVLVPYLGSSHDRAALRLSQRIAEATGAAVTVLHVIRPDRQERLGVGEQVHQVFAEPGAAGNTEVRFKAVPNADPGAAVVAESKSGYDLVLIGVGPQWGLEHRPFGIQSEFLIRECMTSLLVVRQADPAVVLAREHALADEGPPRPSFTTLPEQS